MHAHKADADALVERVKSIWDEDRPMRMLLGEGKARALTVGRVLFYSMTL